MASKTSSVEVAIRVRPMRPELNEEKVSWDIHRNSIAELNSENETSFTFDRVYDPTAETEDIYERSVKESIVRNVVQGYNGTVFAYGQTGSGKSHTMLGDKAGKGVSSMALHDLFAGLATEEAKGKTVKVFLEMLEIYNEQLRDLMCGKDAGAGGKLTIRENEHGVYVHNAVRKPVKNAAECLASMEEEAKNRVVASTKMNEQSSRSHCLIRIIVEKSEFFDADSSDSDDDGGGGGSPASFRAPGRKLEKKVVSSMNLVDLAGSERVSKTGATGQRMIEGGHINKSLTCLTTVIHQLSEPAPKGRKGAAAPHIAFRDSKLTHLLKTALGGNSYTTVFCCITPAVQHTDESRSTLYFAQRAKAIKNTVTTNEVMDNKTRIRDLEAQVKKMRRLLVASDIYVMAKELMVRKTKEAAQSGNLAEAAASANEHVERLESLVTELTRENETLKEEQQQAAQYLGIGGGTSSSNNGGGGHQDPMGGMMGFADSEEVARLKERLRELEEDLHLANDDRQGLIHANQELEEICSLAGRDVEEKEEALTALRAKMRKADSEVQVLQSELASKVNQLEQAAEQRRQHEEAMMERARGDELLERLTDLQSRNQELQLEYDTLIDMYSKIEIESAADKASAAEEMKDLERKLEHQTEDAHEHSALLWRFIAMSDAAAQGEAVDPADAAAHHGTVKATRAEQALKSLELFVASRANRPPAVADASPQRAAVGGSGGGGGGPSPAPAASSSSGGEVEALQSKVKELEAQLEISASRRDIIIDTKLKRMQDLVLRLHTTNTRLLEDVKSVCEENNGLHDLIRRESKVAKLARKDGFEPANEALLKNRALFAPVPEPPHLHN